MAAIVFPIYIARPGTLTHVSFYNEPGTFPPPAIGARVRPLATPDEELLALSFETPLQRPSPGGASKAALENFYIRKFLDALTDINANDYPWSVVRAGSDPPDFVATDGEKEFGIELTQFTSEKRRVAHAEFRMLRDSLLKLPAEHFAKLRGHLAYFWADHEHDGRIARKERKTIIRLLENYVPVANPFPQLTSGNMPVAVPAPMPGSLPPWRVLAVRKQGNPHSALFESLGFDLGLCLLTTHSTTEAKSEMHRLISTHDKPGCDVLVIQVGAPDRDGLVYPADDEIVRLALSRLAVRKVETKHIKRVFVHIWSDNSITEFAKSQSPTQ